MARKSFPAPIVVHKTTRRTNKALQRAKTDALALEDALNTAEKLVDTAGEGPGETIGRCAALSTQPGAPTAAPKSNGRPGVPKIDPEDIAIFESDVQGQVAAWSRKVMTTLGYNNLKTLGMLVGDPDYVARIMNGNTRNPGLTRLMRLDRAVQAAALKAGLMVPSLLLGIVGRQQGAPESPRAAGEDSVYVAIPGAPGLYAKVPLAGGVVPAEALLTVCQDGEMWLIDTRRKIEPGSIGPFPSAMGVRLNGRLIEATGCGLHGWNQLRFTVRGVSGDEALPIDLGAEIDVLGAVVARMPVPTVAGSTVTPVSGASAKRPSGR